MYFIAEDQQMLPKLSQRELYFRFVMFLSLFFGLIPFFSAPTYGQESEGVKRISNEPIELRITQLLTEQTAAWNAGDLKKFMQTYWKSDQLTFSGGGRTTRGWQATLERYHQNYAPPKEMGKLHFDELEVTLIESESALVLGNWHLELANNQQRDGNFSLIVKMIDGHWKIIHDHSSELKPETVVPGIPNQ